MMTMTLLSLWLFSYLNAIQVYIHTYLQRIVWSPYSVNSPIAKQINALEKNNNKPRASSSPSHYRPSVASLTPPQWWQRRSSSWCAWHAALGRTPRRARWTCQPGWLPHRRWCSGRADVLVRRAGSWVRSGSLCRLWQRLCLSDGRLWSGWLVWLVKNVYLVGTYYLM